MYNGVIEKEIKEKYNEVFKIIGEKVGLRKLTYETYLGLNENDTRRKSVNRLLEKTLRLRDDTDVCACIDTINKDVKREDRIDKIDSFLKLGEKLYPKKEEKEEIVPPTPDRLFEVNDDEDQKESEEEIKEEKEPVKEDNEIKIDTKNQSKLKKFVKGFGETILATLNVSCLTIAGAATLAGILIHVPVTPGFLAIMLAAPVITYSYKGYKKLQKYLEKRNKKNKKTEEKNEKIEEKENEEEKKEEKEEEKTKAETATLDFGKDLDSPTELKFDEDIENKPLEPDAISDSILGDAKVTPEVPVKEEPKDKTDRELEGKVTENKTSTNVQPSSWVSTMKPNFWVNDNNQEKIDSKNKSSWMDTMKPNFWVNDNNQQMIDSKNESSEKVSNSVNKNGNNLVNDRRQKTIYEAEQTIEEINKKIEGYEQIINKANQRMKEIQDNKYGYPNQYHVDAHHVTKPKREYNELKTQKLKALNEMKKYQDIIHDLSEKVDKIRGTEVPPVTEEVTKHQVPINNWDTKDIYIVNSPDSRIKESIDYTDKFENSHKK